MKLEGSGTNGTKTDTEEINGKEFDKHWLK